MNRDSLIGKKIGQYEIRELIGQGGLATVYVAHQTNLARDVALKLYQLPISNIKLMEINREADQMARLEHPNIVPIYDYGVSGERFYWVMRLMQGRLSDRLRSDWKPSYQEILDIVQQIASALDYCHQKGVIHKDVNPGNIFFDDKGVAYLGNMLDQKVANTLYMGGDAFTPAAFTPANFAAIGTPAYMSPEQWRNQPATAASDQYALGVVAYRLLAGRVPFEGETPYAIMHQALTETPAPLEQFGLIGAEDAIFGAMAKDPAKRYPKLLDFSRDFERGLSLMIGSPTAPRASGKVTIKKSPTPAVLPVKKTTQPRKVFISYSTRDRVVMERLAKDLGSIGHTVWFDHELQNRGGQSWWDAILEQIRQAQLFVFALTPESLVSEPCSREYGYAADLKKQILPVRLVPMKTDTLPPALLQIQWVDYLDAASGIRILTESIDHLPTPPALPKKLPTPPPAPIPLINELWARGTRREEIPASEQMTLLAEVEVLIFDGQNLETVQQLLRQMQVRRDISRMAHQKIDMLINQFFAAPPEPPKEDKRGRWPFGRK